MQVKVTCTESQLKGAAKVTGSKCPRVGDRWMFLVVFQSPEEKKTAPWGEKKKATVCLKMFLSAVNNDRIMMSETLTFHTISCRKSLLSEKHLSINKRLNMFI